MHRRVAPLALALVGLAPALAHAEEPLTKRFDYVGGVDFFASGAALAVDGPDADLTDVDTFVHPAFVEVEALDIALGAELVDALLYWGGSIANDDCAGTTIDDTVTFAPAGMPSNEVTADVCHCSDAGAAAYDVQLCRASVLELMGDPVGSHWLDDFDALIANQGTHNASFSLVLVYRSDILPNRHVAIYDGLLTLWNMGTSSQLVTLDQILVDDPPQADLTWYALEGDVAGFGDEGVDVVGQPGGLALDLSDATNPIANPMNHTINTSNPPQLDALGVDIDAFDIAAALSSGDTSLDITYRGGSDKYWIAYNIVGVNIYAPYFGKDSGKSWILQQDNARDGEVNPGDVVRYSIALANDGNAPGSVSLVDAIPPEAASWTLVDGGGGSDVSQADTLLVEDIMVGPGQTREVVIDVVIAELPASTQMLNVADFTSSEGELGSLVAPPVPIVVAGAGESTGEGESGETSSGSETGDAGETSSGTSEGSGSSGGVGESDTSAADTQADEVGTSGGPGGASEGGCSCASERDPSERNPSGALLLLALLGLRRRARVPSM